jgi:hypothetical protein
MDRHQRSRFRHRRIQAAGLIEAEEDAPTRNLEASGKSMT